MARKIDRMSPLLRAFALLERIVAAEAPVPLGDATAGAGLPKPTVYRMLAVLEDAGLVMREPGGRRVSAGPRLTRLALDVLRQGSARGPRRAILQALAATIGETVNLTAIEGGDVVYLDRVESDWPLRIALQPGSRVPLHCSASGKLLLALMPAARRKRLVDALPLTRSTPQTIVDRRTLARELLRIRNARLALDNEEFIAGLVCIAVPVTLRDGRVVASVAVQAPVARMTAATALRHVPALRDAADALAATMDADAGTRATRSRARAE
ncbi:MAG: IclR family transcriptional regulator [Betaproteobacteria bacterium]